MIVDRIENIYRYKDVSSDLFMGLDFLKTVDKDINIGTYVINENVKVIVSEYTTVECFERGYEAHRHVVDIQYPICGLEKVKWSPINGMEINIPYDEDKDRIFYKKPSPYGCDIVIGNGVFAIMFPEDGHSPQHLVEKKEVIKKITVKVLIR